MTTENDLKTRVKEGLLARKSDWKRIAQEVPSVSRSWCYQFATGRYKSEPAHSRLVAVDEWLRAAA